RHSGIGTYIRNVLPGVMDSFPNNEFALLGGEPDFLNRDGFQKANARFVRMRSPVFGVFEQAELSSKIPPETGVFWSPNYNFPFFYRRKLMVTVHDLFHLAAPGTIREFPRRIYARTIFRKLVRRADSILCVSEFTRSELERRAGGKGERTRVVHNGVDPFWFGPGEPLLPGGKPFLLFVGNVKPHKNLGRLLKAFALIQDRIPHDLVLAGKKEGFRTGDLRTLKEAAKLNGRVHFTGLVEEKVLRSYYASADLLVF